MACARDRRCQTPSQCLAVRRFSVVGAPMVCSHALSGLAVPKVADSFAGNLDSFFSSCSSGAGSAARRRQRCHHRWNVALNQWWPHAANSGFQLNYVSGGLVVGVSAVSGVVSSLPLVGPGTVSLSTLHTGSSVAVSWGRGKDRGGRGRVRSCDCLHVERIRNYCEGAS